jgi:hypothetical protein
MWGHLWVCAGCWRRTFLPLSVKPIECTACAPGAFIRLGGSEWRDAK